MNRGKLKIAFGGHGCKGEKNRREKSDVSTSANGEPIVFRERSKPL